MLKFRPAPKFNQSALILFVTKDQFKKAQWPSELPAELRQRLSGLKGSALFQGEFKELYPLVLDRQAVVLAGVGDAGRLTSTALRSVVRQAVLSGFLKSVKDLELIPHAGDEATVVSVIEGVTIGTYSWNKYFSDKSEAPSGLDKEIYLIAGAKKSFADALAISEGVNFARDLINDNADVVTSEVFEAKVKEIVRGRKEVSLEILNKKYLQVKGLNLHLAVNQGSPKEPKLIIVKYTGAGKDAPYTALVGKGITFDTGGLNLKPTGSMETMRTDMSGAAAVVATLRNTVALSLKKNVIFACPLAENAMGSCAFKPGDVFTGYAGKSVEIGNTDAEGRLVLADAISYIIDNYHPARLIDIATLTGACVIALGHDYSGLVSTDDALAATLASVSVETDDRVWRLPNYPELKDAVKSPVADIKNVGLPKGAAGTLTAAEFLRQFTQDIPWAHLDIAGTAYAEKGRLYFGHGATGAGVRLLTRYLMRH